jgi:hypothetical protein
MLRRLSPEEAAELLELEQRLERLKVGIGGAVLTISWAPAGSPERAEAETRVEVSTGEALAVRDRILALRGGAPRQSPPETAGVAGGAGEWPPDPGGPTVTVAGPGATRPRMRAARPVRPFAVARHVNIYEVPASAPPRH